MAAHNGNGGRMPPHDLLAEAHLLGAAMLDAGALEVAAGVPVECFYKPAHTHVAQALHALHTRGQPADPVTVGYELTRAGLLDAVGGNAALVELMAHAPATSNADHHAQIIRDTAARRRLLALAGELAETAHASPDTSAAIETAEALLAQAAAGMNPDGEITLTRASDIAPTRPAWAWDQRIPLAGVTLVPGREGEGKTAFLAHLAARWSRGDLPGDLYGQPSDVVYIGHEDDRASVLVPRLMAAGADLDRFLFLDLRNGEPFTLTRSLTALSRLLARRPRIAAVIIDPLDAHLGAADSHKKADVQAAVGQLASLTQQHRFAGVGIAHLNKGDSRDVLLKVVGSVGFTTSVRSVVAIGPHPTELPDERIKVAVVRKANMTDGDQVPATRFRVEGTHVPSPDNGPPIRTAHIALLGEETGIDADSILNTPGPASEERSPLDTAADWLADVLADGPMAKAEIVALARHENIKDRTLERAAERLDVTVERDRTRRGAPAVWSLAAGTGDYSPTISRQPPLARNQHPSDQEQHPGTGHFSPTPTVGEKPPDGPLSAHRACTRCDRPATDISGLCPTCIHPRPEEGSGAPTPEPNDQHTPFSHEREHQS